MTETWPWTFSNDDPAGPELENRLQDVLDAIGQKFPVGIANVSQVPQARVYNNAALTIATAAQTALTFNTERWDKPSDNIHSTAANTSRLTCVVPGLYAMTASIEWAANAIGFRQLILRLNGGAALNGVVENAVAGGTVHQQEASTQYRLVAGDYVEAVVQQTSGGNLNVNATGNYTPEFSMHWVSP